LDGWSNIFVQETDLIVNVLGLYAVGLNTSDPGPGLYPSSSLDPIS